MTTIMAFPASAALAGHLQAIQTQQQEAPNVVHHNTLRHILDHFLAEVLGAYFTGPIEAVQAEGPVVDMIQRGVGVISKAGRALALRLLDKLEAGDQANLVQHFQQLQHTIDGQLYVAFAFTAADAAQVRQVLAAVANGEAEQLEAFLAVLHLVGDGAVSHYLDGTARALTLGRFSKGLVKATQATVRKSISAAINRGVPALGGKYRAMLAAYYASMLFEV